MKVISEDQQQPLNIKVTDLYGRVIELRTVKAGQSFTIGDLYKSGNYIVSVQQGNKQKQIKIIKL